MFLSVYSRKIILVSFSVVFGLNTVEQILFYFFFLNYFYVFMCLKCLDFGTVGIPYLWCSFSENLLDDLDVFLNLKVFCFL